jgi:phosphorylase kinase alpha/beta subunit
MELIPSIQVRKYFIFTFFLLPNLLDLYRRIDDDRGKSHELGQSAVKCMRGILECWIRQADRVEQFKQNQSNQFALHCKFHLETGDTVLGDDEYFHLQVHFLFPNVCFF